MKFNDVSFPHPVLGVGESINSKFGLDPKPKIEKNDVGYSVIVHCFHDNEDLDNLITNKQAKYLCEVSCSNTIYREIFTSDNEKIIIKIPRKNVKGKVTFTCMLVATLPFNDYRNKNSHIDYNDYKIDIEIGDVLAFFGEFEFNADIKYEKLCSVTSFMEVVENKNELATYTNIDLNKNKIEVQIPTEEYKKFASDDISKEQKYASIFHSSIVLNALLIALYNFEQYKDFLWAKVVIYRLKNEDGFAYLSIEDKVHIPEIAQRLLGNPFKRLLFELDAFKKNTNLDVD